MKIGTDQALKLHRNCYRAPASGIAREHQEAAAPAPAILPPEAPALIAAS